MSSRELLGSGKRLSAFAAVLACAGAIFPAAAQARGGIIGFTAKAPKGATMQPAISAAPNNSQQEWFVVSGNQSSTLMSINRSGKIAKVSSSTLSAGSSIGASYGSAVVDGDEWLVKYGAASSPLYAVSPSGAVSEVEQSVGSDITDITAGPDNTLSFSSSSGQSGILTCTVTSSPSAAATCLQPVNLLGQLLSLLTGLLTGNFASNDVQSITANSSQLWFTDAQGQLGSFNLLSYLGSVLGDLLGGPYGDTSSGSGEGSSSANTVASNPNGYLYLAGGQFENENHDDNTIIAVNPSTGQTVSTYTQSLSNVTAVTSGPDGNVWFLDRKSATAGRVGMLNVTTGQITEYKLPKGYRLSQNGSEIADGPSGTGTLYFTLQTNSGKPAIGEVTGA